VVKAGETLQQLAEKYYGDSSKWRTIFDANRGFVRLDGKLETGMELEVPAK
jgi:nucleoid-associated protein YgaU